jgi:hypothetical protein
MSNNNLNTLNTLLSITDKTKQKVNVGTQDFNNVINLLDLAGCRGIHLQSQHSGAEAGGLSV